MAADPIHRDPSVESVVDRIPPALSAGWVADRIPPALSVGSDAAMASGCCDSRHGGRTAGILKLT